jgi:hypothetical protein
MRLPSPKTSTADAAESPRRHFTSTRPTPLTVLVAMTGHLAHDVAAGRDHPGLELLRLRVEAHDGVRPRVRDSLYQTAPFVNTTP